MLTTAVASSLELFHRHRPAARAIARKIHGRLPRRARLDDIQAAALVGLWDAACRFDPGRGGKFTSYFPLRVHGEVMDWIRQQGSRSRTDYARGQQEPLPFSQLAVPRRRNRDEARIHEIRTGGMVPDPRAQKHERRLEAMDLIRLGLGALSPVEAECVRLYYLSGLTMLEVGRLIGRHESGVSLILTRVLPRLRRRLARHEHLVQEIFG